MDDFGIVAAQEQDDARDVLGLRPLRTRSLPAVQDIIGFKGNALNFTRSSSRRWREAFLRKNTLNEIHVGQKSGSAMARNSKQSPRGSSRVWRWNCLLHFADDHAAIRCRPRVPIAQTTQCRLASERVFMIYIPQLRTASFQLPNANGGRVIHQFSRPVHDP